MRKLLSLVLDYIVSVMGLVDFEEPLDGFTI